MGRALWLMLALAAMVGAEPPRGWGFDSSAPGYAAQLDRQVAHAGGASGSLKSVGTPTGWAVLNQKVPAARYRGLRLRLSGYLRTQDVAGRAGLWLRVDSAQATTLEFDNMAAQPVRGSTPWKQYSLELVVPPEAESIHFGALLVGTGQVWLDDVSLEGLGPVPPGSRERLRVREPGHLNLELEE